jgi:hypothetical protein
MRKRAALEIRKHWELDYLSKREAGQIALVRQGLAARSLPIS